MTSLTDSQYLEYKDSLVFNAYSNDCCSEDFISLIRIMFMIYEWDSISDITFKNRKYNELNEKIKYILINTCKHKSSKTPNDIEFTSFYSYITDFYLKNYNTITRTNKKVCFCDIIRVINSHTFLFYGVAINNTNYNLIIQGIPSDTISLIQKYIN